MRRRLSAWRILALTGVAVATLGWPASDMGRAAEPAVAGQEPVKYAPGDIHCRSSRVVIHVGKVGLGHEHAVVGLLKSGYLRLGATERAGELVFDMASFRADTDEARKFLRMEGSVAEGTRREVDQNMLGKDVLYVTRYPTAAFAIRSAQPIAGKDGSYLLEGEFTLRGVTRPLKLAVYTTRHNSWLQVRAGFSILQSDFGIVPFRKALGAVGVSDRLQIWGELWVALGNGSRSVRFAS